MMKKLLLVALFSASTFAADFPFTVDSIEGNIYPCTSITRPDSALYCTFVRQVIAPYGGAFVMYVSDQDTTGKDETGQDSSTGSVNPIITSKTFFRGQITIDFDNPVKLKK